MEKLKKLCVELTQENVDKLESKYYANGSEKKTGDLLLYVMLIEDDLKEDKIYHLLPINFNDLGKEYRFTGRYFDENNTTSEFHFPIVEGKFIQPQITDLKEFNNYIKQFPTKKDINAKQLLFDYNFTINGISHNEIYDDVEQLKMCDKISFDVINRIKKMYNVSEIEESVLLKSQGVELLEWLRTFKSLEKIENRWVLGRQISSEQLYDSYLNDRKQWRKQQK